MKNIENYYGKWIFANTVMPDLYQKCIVFHKGIVHFCIYCRDGFRTLEGMSSLTLPITCLWMVVPEGPVYAQCKGIFYCEFGCKVKSDKDGIHNEGNGSVMMLKMGDTDYLHEVILPAINVYNLYIPQSKLSFYNTSYPDYHLYCDGLPLPNEDGKYLIFTRKVLSDTSAVCYTDFLKTAYMYIAEYDRKNGFSLDRDGGSHVNIEDIYYYIGIVEPSSEGSPWIHMTEDTHPDTFPSDTAECLVQCGEDYSVAYYYNCRFYTISDGFSIEEIHPNYFIQLSW